jgi:hypothetical protein
MRSRQRGVTILASLAAAALGVGMIWGGERASAQIRPTVSGTDSSVLHFDPFAPLRVIPSGTDTIGGGDPTTRPTVGRPPMRDPFRPPTRSPFIP